MADQVADTPAGIGPMTQAEAAAQYASLLGGDPEPSEVDEEEAELAEDSEDEEGEPGDAEEGDEDPDESADEDEETADEEAEEEADEEPALHTVKIDGEEVEVTLDELKKGYSRQADYTKKRQVAAEQEKALAQELALVQAERSKYAAGLDSFLAAQQGNRPEEPDWSKVDANDPVEVAKSVKYMAWERKVEAAQRERNFLQQQQLRQQQADKAKAIADSMTALKATLPGWNDDNKVAADIKMIRDHAIEAGLAAEMVDEVTDPIVITLMWQAARFAQLQKQAQVKTKARSGKPLKAGPKKAPEARAIQVSKLNQRLRQSGSIDDAVALYLAGD